MPAPIASLTPVDGFRDYVSLFARHQSLMTLHDEVAGQVVGQTVSGRDISAYVLGDADDTTAEGFAEAAVLVNGAIHAREWQTPEAVTGLFEALVEARSDAGFGQYLIENLTTVLVPVNNVDGFLQTQLYPDGATADRAQPREGRMRRKNLRNPETQGAIDSDIVTVGDNFWGVDLNRNSAAGFGQQNRSSSSVTSLIYRATAPNSEPELLALQAAASLGPAARLRFYSDMHSFGQVYFAPTTGNDRRDVITATLAARMRADVARQYLLGFYRQSGPPAAIAAQIRDTQNGAVVYDARWQRNSATTRSLNLSTNSALVPGRTYRLWVAFNKPMRIRDAGGAVVAYRGQSTAAAVGTVTLEIPSPANQNVALAANAQWLNTPGGAPDGYLHYADDAFAVDFTLPATINITAPTPAVLAMKVQDIARMSLDSDPSTAVDWNSGNWVRYENATGVAGDVGGTDCTFRPFIATQAAAAPPATTHDGMTLPSWDQGVVLSQMINYSASFKPPNYS
ncbi:MAG TPA: M14 family zinc carboxypeptidase [Steroidobacteraceae bacterium]|nr:M14 family zinc carboxypeptidase [Steroidobacteraceae bacterium]